MFNDFDTILNNDMKNGILHYQNISREKFFTFLLALFFGAGIIFHSIDFTRPLVLKITDIFLLITNIIVFYFVLQKRKDNKIIVWSLLVYILTFLIEYAGVQTGKIFGEYIYGDTMLIKIGNVPVVIAFNWTILILATYSISRMIIKNRWLIPFLSSVLIVVFDYMMEPVAMKFDYWNWANDHIPIQNYIAWFVISLIAAFGLSVFRIRPKGKILNYYFVIQLIFFSFLRIFSL